MVRKIACRRIQIDPKSLQYLKTLGGLAGTDLIAAMTTRVVGDPRVQSALVGTGAKACCGTRGTAESFQHSIAIGQVVGLDKTVDHNCWRCNEIFETEVHPMSMLLKVCDERQVLQRTSQ